MFIDTVNIDILTSLLKIGKKSYPYIASLTVWGGWVRGGLHVGDFGIFLDFYF